MPEEPSGAAWASIDLILEKHMGLLAYLNDIYGLAIERISAKITSEFADRIIQRTYVHAVELGWRLSASREEALYMQVVSLFIAHFFAIVKHSPLLADAMSALFVLPSDDSDEALPGSRLFVPAPLEPSRTLAPWACIALEVLGNKAISPSALVKSVLTPRRMLRTRALLDSLTGDDASESNGSHSPPPQLNNSQLASTAVTSMAHVLIDDLHMHSWITVDLAALLISELCGLPNGQIVIEDQALVRKLVAARDSQSAELRAMLLSTGSGSGRWKIVVKCLVDFANSAADTLRIKAQAEGRHIFSSAEHSLQQEQQRPVSPFESPPVQQRYTDRSFEAMVHQVHNAKWICSALLVGPPSLLSQQTTAGDQSDAQQIKARGSYARDLLDWISGRGGGGGGGGAGYLSDAESLYDSGFDSVVIDNAAKNALPRSVTKLGFSARIACHNGCLIIWHHQQSRKENESIHQPPDLVWPLADVNITETTLRTDACELPAIRLTDTPFPQPFFPARPQSLGGISISSSVTAAVASARLRGASSARNSSNSNRRKLFQYSYVGSQRALDISLRFMDDMECADAEGLVQHHALVSQQLLSEILFNHNVI
ncbi:hypothetical protein GGI23_004433 [Coemansia sp. RSA 2559]|nr:hypothetical protein GGI23_004433 [Coemansia sp. RSA 2559]